MNSSVILIMISCQKVKYCFRPKFYVLDLEDVPELLLKEKTDLPM